jgi:hypothetical protein
MVSRQDFYREKAEQCEERAGTELDPMRRAEWLKMAADWRSLLHTPRERIPPDG